MSLAVRQVGLNTTETEVYETEHHLHSHGKWFGATAAPPGGGVGPGLITSLDSFRATTHATAQTFGTAIVVFNGTESMTDTFTVAKFEPHEIFITNAEAAGTYKIRFADSKYTGGADTYANMAAAVAAGDFTEVVFKADNTNAESGAHFFQSKRVNAGSKVWAQIMQLAAGAKYVDFVVGVHCYEK